MVRSSVDLSDAEEREDISSATGPAADEVSYDQSVEQPNKNCRVDAIKESSNGQIINIYIGK